MKKVLFTTTALIATGGMAAADVTMSGSARFGVVYNSAMEAAGASKTKVEKRMRLTFNGSGETDSGLNFGMVIRVESNENDGAGAASNISGAGVHMGNDMFKISVGNTNGAMVQRFSDFAHGNIGLTGTTWSNISFNMGNSNWTLASFSSGGGGDADVVRLDINAGDFGASISTDSSGDHLSNDSEDALSISYNMGDWKLGLGMADETNGTKVTRASVTGSVGDLGMQVSYTDKEDLGSKVVLAGSYSMSSNTSLTGFVANTSEATSGSIGIGGVAGTQDTEYGLGFSHSLGGASLKGGVSQNWTGETMADLGVSFGF